jgi:hypothetical protein
MKSLRKAAEDYIALRRSLGFKRKRPTITRTSRSGKSRRVVLRARTPNLGPEIRLLSALAGRSRPSYLYKL